MSKFSRRLFSTSTINRTTSTVTPATQPPKPSYFTSQTIYPFLLLSAMTSLALNLSYSRSSYSQKTNKLKAQISILQTSLTFMKAVKNQSEKVLVIESIERELEMVGLGKVKEVNLNYQKEGETTWREVLLGKKGVKYEPIVADVDWEQVIKEAEAPVETPTNSPLPPILRTTAQVYSTTSDPNRPKPPISSYL